MFFLRRYRVGGGALWVLILARFVLLEYVLAGGGVVCVGFLVWLGRVE